MGIGVGIVLAAVGAILALAVHIHGSAVNIQMVGWILMAAGGFAILVSLVFWSSWGPGSFSRRDQVNPPAGPGPGVSNY
jgi:H+/Cl- antiporter ClcA